MERLALEFHDSTVEVIRWRESDAIFEMNVYVHASAGRPGWDPGRGWYQDAELVLTAADIRQRPSGDFLDITVGSLRVDGQVFDNLLPLPCDITGGAEIVFSGQEGTLAATGKGVRVELKGEPGTVEEFRAN